MLARGVRQESVPRPGEGGSANAAGTGMRRLAGIESMQAEKRNRPIWWPVFPLNSKIRVSVVPTAKPAVSFSSKTAS